jgi:hypothetical protein
MGCYYWSNEDDDWFRGLCTNQLKAETILVDDESKNCIVCARPGFKADTCSDCLVAPPYFSFVFWNYELIPQATVTKAEVDAVLVGRIGKCFWEGSIVTGTEYPVYDSNIGSNVTCYHKVTKKLSIRFGGPLNAFITVQRSIEFRGCRNSADGPVIGSAAFALFAEMRGTSQTIERNEYDTVNHRCYPTSIGPIFTDPSRPYRGQLIINHAIHPPLWSLIGPV